MGRAGHKLRYSRFFTVFIALAVLGTPVHGADKPFSFSEPTGFGAFCHRALARLGFFPPARDLEVALKGVGIGPDIDFLGQGGLGTVWKGVGKNRKGETVNVVIKEPHVSFDSDSTASNIRHLRQEAEILKAIYPGLVRVVELKDRPIVITELFPADSSNPGKPAPTLKSVLYETMAGAEKFSEGTGRDLAYLRLVEKGLLDQTEMVHQRGYIHGDLKPENILIGTDARGDPVVRIIDFGLSRKPTPDNPYVVYGTPAYMSSEAFIAKRVSAERDVRALQKVLAEVYLRDQYRDINSVGVRRSHFGTIWSDIPRAYDAHPSVLPPELGVVLISKVPRTVSELRELLDLAHAKNQTKFIEEYAKRWEAAYDRATKEKDAQVRGYQSRELVVELLSAPNLGPRIFQKLSEPVRTEITAEMDRIKTVISAITSSPAMGEYLGMPVSEFEKNLSSTSGTLVIPRSRP